MPKTNDAYGAELWDYYKTKEDKREIVERDDKFIAGARDGYGGAVYFSEHQDWALHRKKGHQIRSWPRAGRRLRRRKACPLSAEEGSTGNWD
jgi:hypothetical protein